MKTYINAKITFVRLKDHVIATSGILSIDGESTKQYAPGQRGLDSWDAG